MIMLLSLPQQSHMSKTLCISSQNRTHDKINVITGGILSLWPIMQRISSRSDSLATLRARVVRGTLRENEHVDMSALKINKYFLGMLVPEVITFLFANTPFNKTF